MIRDAVADADLEECSFMPKTNKAYIVLDNLTGETTYKDQSDNFSDKPFERLHDSARGHKFKNRKDKDSEQIDYEKNSEYCTFSPVINRKRGNAKIDSEYFTVESARESPGKCKSQRSSSSPYKKERDSVEKVKRRQSRVNS